MYKENDNKHPAVLNFQVLIMPMASYVNTFLIIYKSFEELTPLCYKPFKHNIIIWL
ncbi:Uncharacterized protein dnl_57970 [Desulfonema limicola]|uniref:Uncharacterized protein n=1 Tax=Desulfonema limicola TaxID=45656 RepID=A0A975BDM7_9BACT|nr:Uncharacterized protein dnl_57970 [Desulfonema limicola]